MKKTSRRLISLLLTICMLVGQVPQALAAPGQGTIPLAGMGINLPEDAEGTFLAFAANSAIGGNPNAQWDLEERGRYSITIYLAG